MDNKKNYEIRLSTRKNKKYMARYINSKKWVHFGDQRYDQYRDSTPLMAYRGSNHLDDNRKLLYKRRHENNRHHVGSAGWLSDVFLWS